MSDEIDPAWLHQIGTVTELGSFLQCSLPIARLPTSQTTLEVWFCADGPVTDRGYDVSLLFERCYINEAWGDHTGVDRQNLGYVKSRTALLDLVRCLRSVAEGGVDGEDC